MKGIRKVRPILYPFAVDLPLVTFHTNALEVINCMESH